MNIFIAVMLIRFGVGLTMMMFGFDQLLHPEVWAKKVLPAWLAETLPISPESDIKTSGFGNLLFGGLLMFTFGIPKITIWIALFWWLYTLPFSFGTSRDLGMRDLSIIFALVALLFLQP